MNGLKVGILSSDTTVNVEDFVQKYQLATYVELLMGTDAIASKLIHSTLLPSL